MAFQKRSPYINDFNEILELALQMGIVDVTSYVQNSTKCSTWSKIEESHRALNIVVLKMEDIYGPIILILTGLTTGIITFFMELAGDKLIGKKSTNKRKRSNHPSLMIDRAGRLV